MSIALNAGDTLPMVLERIDRRGFERCPAQLAQVSERHDYSLRESLKNRLIATPRRGGADIEARMSMLRPMHSYTIVAGRREIDVLRVGAHGGNAAQHAHHELVFVEGKRECGRADYFPNTGFVFGNKEPCLKLTILSLDGHEYIQYTADSHESWWKSRRYTVTVDARRQPVATIVSAPSLLTSRRHLQLEAELPPALVGLLMAADHGFIFRSS